MEKRTILVSAAASGFIAVALGAFGAHGLQTLLVANSRVDTFETAVTYHFYHTFALVAVGLLVDQYPRVKSAAPGFLLGILIFSGSLYLLSVTNVRWLGAITPFGGIALLTGWALLAGALLKKNAA